MSSKWYMAEGDLDSMIHRQDADSGSVAGSMWFVFLREKINDSKLVTAYVPCEIQGEEQQSMGRFSLSFLIICSAIYSLEWTNPTSSKGSSFTMSPGIASLFWEHGDPCE